MFISKIGIDLGTCNSVVFTSKGGVVLREPSVVAVNESERKILAVGIEAKRMIGKTPEDIQVYRPLKDGVIADYRATEAMLRYFLKKVGGFWNSFLKPELLVGVPAGSSSAEKRAVIEAGMQSGAKAVYLAKEPILSALGAGVPINESAGHMIVDIGGGTAEVAVISLGGIVSSASVRVAGDKIDESITEYVKRKYNLAIGEQTTEEIKIKIGTAVPLKTPVSLDVKGRDLISGLPRTIKISSNEVAEAISDPLHEIIHTVKVVLRDTLPELSADIIDKGIVLAGGGALLAGIDEKISQEIGIPCFIADDPLSCVAKGTGIMLENLELYKKSVMSKK